MVGLADTALSPLSGELLSTLGPSSRRNICGASVLCGLSPGPSDMAEGINSIYTSLRLSTGSVPGPPCNDSHSNYHNDLRGRHSYFHFLDEVTKDQRGENTCPGPLAVSEAPDSSPAWLTAQLVFSSTRLSMERSVPMPRGVWHRAAGGDSGWEEKDSHCDFLSPSLPTQSPNTNLTLIFTMWTLGLV